MPDPSPPQDWWQNSLSANADARKTAHQESKPSPPNPALCMTCQTIDFPYLLFGSSETGFRHAQHESVYLGTLRNIWKRALKGCPFCADILLPQARRLLELRTGSADSIPTDDRVSVTLEVSDNVFSREAPTLHRSNGIYVCIKQVDPQEDPQQQQQLARNAQHYNTLYQQRLLNLRQEMASRLMAQYGPPTEYPPQIAQQYSAGLEQNATIYVQVIMQRERDEKNQLALPPVVKSVASSSDSGEMAHPAICLFDHELSAYRGLKPRIEPGVCKSWLQSCCDSHETCAGTKSSELTSPSTVNNPYFKLIDTRTREVVVLGDGNPPPYAILSYVCGEAYTVCVLHKSTSWVTDEKGIARHPLPPVLPKTIEDALLVTAGLGLEYLWIDSLCIAQDEEKEKHAQILAMYHIYARSEVCIIAASGNNSTHGLPGVRESRKMSGAAAGVAIRGSLRLGYPQRVLHEILKEYRWMRRAWTYQEILLARRCLIFTETEAFFFCGKSTFRESMMKGSGEREHWADGNGHLIGNTAAMVSEKDETRPQTLRRTYDAAVVEYSQRELSFQQDGRNAFRGMETFFGELFGCETIAGCPTAVLANCVAWIPQSVICEQEEWPLRRMMRDLEDTTQDGDLHLIPLLPSWAWAAWKGASRLRAMPIFLEESEMKILRPDAFSLIPYTAGDPYKFTLTGDPKKRPQSLSDVLPVLGKVSRGYFKITPIEDVPGFVDIITPDGKEVGDCDVRGMLDTTTLDSAKPAVLLQIRVGSKCAVMLLQLHDLLERQPNLAQDLVTEASAAVSQDAFLEPMKLDPRFAKKMEGECPAELVVCGTVPSSCPMLATRIGLGDVNVDAWKGSKPQDAFVILA